MRKEELSYVKELLSSIENPLIKKRVENILIWDIKRANLYRLMFYIMSVIIIIANATIPVIINLTDWCGSKLIASILSALAGVLTSVLTLVGIKDKWCRYRKYAEQLKSECFLFLTKSGKYSGENGEYEFVINIESITSEERKQWEYSTFRSAKPESEQENGEQDKDKKADSEE